MMEKKLVIYTIEAGILKQGSIDGVLYNMIPVINEECCAEGKQSLGRVIKKHRRKRKRKLPEGCVGYDETYHAYITKDEEMNVRRAVSHVEHGWKPTTSNIHSYITDTLRVSITIDRLQGVLHWMKMVGIIRKVDVLDRMPVYGLVIKED